MDVHVSFWAVLAAAVSAMVVGSIWYSPKTFAPAWIKLARIDTSKNRGSIARPMIISFIVCLITAYVLAHVAYIANQFFHHSFLHDSIVTALWLWLGLTAARFVTHDAFEGRPAMLTVLNTGCELVTLVVMGLLIGLIGS